jgi:hypothetical protein
VALLVSCATVASLAAPGLADDGEALASTNLAPVAVDDEATATSGQLVVVPVLDNDSDPDPTSSSVMSLAGVTVAPTTGTAVVSGDAIEYIAASTFEGTDTFTYEITDGELTAQAMVTVTVTAAPNQAPTPTADRASTTWGKPVVVDVVANDLDPDGDPVELLSVGSTTRGLATVVRGRVRFEPTTKLVGEISLPYTVQDARGATASGELRVRVRPAHEVSIARAGNAVAQRRLTVRGSVSTLLDGPVVVALQRRTDSGRWFTLTDRRLREDRFTISWTPNQPGRAVLRLRATWGVGPAAETGTERVLIEARFDPVVSRVRASDVPHSWRPGCPVGPSGLRKIEMSYWDYSGRLQRGTLIGAAYVTQDYIAIFRRAFNTGFQIKKMYPVDRYGGVDERAMRAGNTSAFNCRHVTGNPYRMSQHSYGDAIDINTFENPYVTGSHVYPPKAAVPYYFRREHNLRDPGVITSGSSIARELWAQGWSWGARWSPPDYQHWSKNGG